MTRKSADLQIATDPRWVQVILDRFDEFLCDHANCERKASALALSLAVKHPDRAAIVPTLIGLAREELEHFEQVYALMARRGLALVPDAPDPYVNGLRAHMRHGREERFLDRLLVASLVESRGAERFRIIARALPEPELAGFYDGFWKAEAKHAHQFADMALVYFPRAVVYARLHELAAAEAALVQRLEWRASLH